MHTIMIDFDGVLHRYSRGWADGSIYDGPVEGAKEALSFLKNECNCKIVIFTARALPASREMIEAWLKQHEIPYDDISNVKVPAILYIDDRGYRFEGTWIENLSLIIKIIEKE